MDGVLCGWFPISEGIILWISSPEGKKRILPLHLVEIGETYCVYMKEKENRDIDPYISLTCLVCLVHTGTVNWKNGQQQRQAAPIPTH